MLAAPRFLLALVVHQAGLSSSAPFLTTYEAQQLVEVVARSQGGDRQPRQWLGMNDAATCRRGEPLVLPAGRSHIQWVQE